LCCVYNTKEDKGKWCYLVKWRGYRLEESTWEPEANLKNMARHLKNYGKFLRKKSLDTAKGLELGDHIIDITRTP
jgi:hypothetical protein